MAHALGSLMSEIWGHPRPTGYESIADHFLMLKAIDGIKDSYIKAGVPGRLR